MEDVAREALRVDAHQGRRASGEFAHFEDDGFLGAGPRGGFEAENPKHAELGGKVRFGHFREPWRSGCAHANC